MENECILWDGSIEHGGYAVRYDHRVSRSAIRISREILSERLGRALTAKEHACHVCDVPVCVNPDHLFLGNAKANQRDKTAKGRHHNQQKTHCKNGHEFSVENVRLYAGAARKFRVCRACERERSRVKHGL